MKGYEFLKSKLNIKRVKNRFKAEKVEYGYRDVNIIVDFEGLLCEIQITLREFYAIRKNMHPYYRIIRSTFPSEL